VNRQEVKKILVSRLMSYDSEELAKIFLATLESTGAAEVTEKLATEARWQIDQDKAGFCHYVAEGALEVMGWGRAV
jgi:hypothetical protein